MQHKKLLLVLLSLALVFLFAACGGGSSTTGDSQSGDTLFHQSVIGTQPGCTTCHSLEPDVVIVGPSLAGVASRAGSRVSGLSRNNFV